MSQLHQKNRPVMLALPAILLAFPAMAREAPPPAGALDAIVVTASAGDRSRLDSAASVGAIAAADITRFNATSTAELYRLIPGIQVSGTQGDGGNSNIGVRGLRTPTGGSPFVQVQEDGLPTVLFGDIQFGNNDYWTRPDPLTERIEAIRGGTASTLASQAIGAVINHISATGRTHGGFVALEKGVDHDWTRINARLGGSLGETSWFNLGGYADTGRGVLDAAYPVHDSWLIRGNVTREFAGGAGFVRLLVKLSDTREPSYNGCLSQGSVTATAVTAIGPSAQCDGRRQTPGYSPFHQTGLFVNQGAQEDARFDGISTRQRMAQLQAHYDFGGVILDDNLRLARMSGTFNVQFYNASPVAGVPGAGQSLIYANGPNAGQVFTGAFVNTAPAIHTTMDHMDHFANDLSLSTRRGLGRAGGGAQIDVKLGWFHHAQRIAENWHANDAILDARGGNPAELALVSGPNGTGDLLSAGGITRYNAGWNQHFDTTFTLDAPYANLALDLGAVTLDGSLRQELFRGRGWAQGSTGATLGTIAVRQVDPRTGQTVVTSLPVLGYDGPMEHIAFSESATNWSAGALYKATPDLSLFARASHGTRFNADRLTRNTPSYFAPDGSLSAAGLPAARYPVTQYELGLKNRGHLLGGRYTVELTGFRSRYAISSQEISRTNCRNVLGIDAPTCTISGSYRDWGAELFATWQGGGLNLVLSATYDRSQVSAAQGQPFRRSPNIPGLTWSALASHALADKAEIGASLTGQTSTLGADQRTWPASAVLGAFVTVRPTANLQLGLQAYNLLNSFALQGTAGVIAGGPFLDANPAQGRAIKATLRFDFR
ncbi:TonB-dependent receptor [Novosphingobium bradum]|uniref:TonB-dependent receptor n=1 Tax=Novosphingobium bradum TaxID=1737444 RepID=A0ABV7IQM9_9SPHN